LIFDIYYAIFETGEDFIRAVQKDAIDSYKMDEAILDAIEEYGEKCSIVHELKKERDAKNART